MENLTHTQDGTQGPETTGEYWHPLWTEVHAARKAAADAWLGSDAVAQTVVDVHPVSDTPEAAA